MKRIDKGYARIFIDENGETLTHDSFVTEDLITEYYATSGAIQWNYYIYIPIDMIVLEPVDGETEESKAKRLYEKIEKIENSTSYARKFVFKREDIDREIEFNFPDQRKEMGRLKLIKGKNWRNAGELAFQEMTCGEKNVLWDCKGSFYRDFSMLDTLTKLDELRMALIKNPYYTLIFYTHIQHEYNLARNKLEQFT